MERKEEQLISFSKTGDYEKRIDNMILEYAIEDPVESYVEAYVGAKYELADWLEKFYNFRKLISVDIATVLVESRICASLDPGAMLKFSQKFGAKFTPLGSVHKILIGMLTNRADHAIDYFNEHKASFTDSKHKNGKLIFHALVHGHYFFADYIYRTRKTFPMVDLVEQWFDEDILGRISRIVSLYYLYQRCEEKNAQEEKKDMRGCILQCILSVVDDRVKRNDLQKVTEICELFPELVELIKPVIDYEDFMDPVFHRRYIPDDSNGDYHNVEVEYMNEDLFLYLVEKFQPPKVKMLDMIDNIMEVAFATKSTKMMKWISDNYTPRDRSRLRTTGWIDTPAHHPI